jgi:hypothetical protein
MISFLLFAHVLCISAQTPITPASGPIAKPSEGFTPGLNAGLKFEDSTNCYRLFNLASAIFAA